MVKALLERSDAEKRGSSAYFLLAAASARESIGVEEAIRKQISDQVEQLIPPRESGLVFELAEAGDLVVPFLGYRDSFDNTDVSRMIMLLGLIDNREADRLLAGYAQDVEIDVEIVDCFMRALDYKADQDLVKKIIDLMKQKSSTRFWTGRRGGILHVASNGLLSYSHVLPPAKCIVFDGRFGLDLIRGFNIEWRAQDKINCLMMLEPQGFLPARMERFKGVRELVFVRAFIDELDASTAIGQLKTIRLIDTEIADWDSLAYAELERLYVAGSVTAKQVYHEQIDLKKFAKTVYATNDFVQTFEALEERHGSGYDTWLLQMWEQHEFESLIHDMGMDGALHEGAGRDGS